MGRRVWEGRESGNGGRSGRFIVVIVSYDVVCLENRKQGCSHFVLFDFTNFFHRVAHFVHFGFEIARPLVKTVQARGCVQERIDSSADIGHLALKLGNRALIVSQCTVRYIHLPIQL